MIFLLLFCHFSVSSLVVFSNPHSASCLQLPNDSVLGDSLSAKQNVHLNDSATWSKDKELKLNDDAIKLIQFDFSSQPNKINSTLTDAPIDKPWMDFKVDLSVPVSMIDSTKLSTSERYIRLLPFSIWTTFGKDPTFDVLVFGNRKRLEFTMNMDFDLDKSFEYGESLLPHAGRYNPNRTIGRSSVVIGNLDFIGFLYSNLNKHGRLLKHNRKHANAWKTYRDAAPSLDGPLYATRDTVRQHADVEENERPGLYHNLKSIELIEEKTPTYFQRPDQHESQPAESRKKRRGRKNRKRDSNEKKQKDEKVIEQLPSRMEDLYLYIEQQKMQDSIQRRELNRKDKVDQNVYELEQQQRKLKEHQN